VPNEQTWLDQTDLVFIDPVGTGFSRATRPEWQQNF
jgi:carboxypeptidase C (cathepsin A)